MIELLEILEQINGRYYLYNSKPKINYTEKHLRYYSSFKYNGKAVFKDSLCLNFDETLNNVKL